MARRQRRRARVAQQRLHHERHARAARRLVPQPARERLAERRADGALLADGRAEEAQAVFEVDLEQYPMNGWSTFGLAEAMRAQGDEAGAKKALDRFETLWQFADVTLSNSIL